MIADLAGRVWGFQGTGALVLGEAMLDLVKDETERIDSRFLEPACGSGNFLVPVLQRKLAAVELKYRPRR